MGGTLHAESACKKQSDRKAAAIEATPEKVSPQATGVVYTIVYTVYAKAINKTKTKNSTTR